MALTLALRQGQLQEAEKRYREAQAIFKRLNEPEMETVFHHQLGMVYKGAKQWDAAEQTYREAARINDEFQGNMASATQIWNNLALVTKDAGKPKEAEAWFRKAIEVEKASEDWLSASRTLSNLAGLLQNQPHRLPEARQLAEEALALAIDKTLDPAAVNIWITYNILTNIAEKQNDTAKATEYRRLSREARAAFAGTRYELRKYGQFIAAVVAAVHKGESPEIKAEKSGRENLVAAIYRVLNGERDKNVLCESLDSEDSMIIYAILRSIENPETLKELLEE